MKTAEQWSMELAEKLVPDTMDAEGQADTRLPYIKAIDIVKQIQLDAFKAGMSEAARLIETILPESKEETIERIIAARDRKTSL